ncbi:MAG: exopolysaccharide transport family protein [Bacteroidia bacterium]
MKESLRYLRPFLRGLPIILFCMIVTVLVVKKYLTYLTPQYESTAKIKLADLAQGVPNNNLFKDLDVFASTNKIAAEIELIKSTIMLSKGVEGMGFQQETYLVGDMRSQELYHNSPILINPLDIEENYDRKFFINVISRDSFQMGLSGSLTSVAARFGDTVDVHNSTFIISPNLKLFELKPKTHLIALYEYVYLSHEKLIDKLKKNLTVVSADKDVPVVSIMYKSPIPQKSADFANHLAETYIRDYIETKFKAAETTVSFLDDRINRVSQQLSTSENKIEDYKDRRGIIDLRQESETDLRKIAQMKIQLSNLKISLDAIQELEDDLRRKDNSFEFAAPNFQAYTDLLSTELVKKIKTLQAEKRDLLLTYTPSNPLVKVVDGKLDDLKVYLIEGVTNSKRNLRTQHFQLLQEIQNAEFAFNGFAKKQKDLTVMTRDFNIYQKSYNFLNEKRIEAEIARAAKISFHRIITPAIPSIKAVSPNKPIITIVSGLLALIGSLALIQIVHSAKGKVNDAETIETQCDIPIAIKTPYLKTKAQISKHFLKEAIQLELKGMTEKSTTLCITSNTPHEGRQFHTRELAKAFTKQGRKVLVLDFNGSISIDNVDVLDMTDKSYREMDKETLRNTISKNSKGYDLIIADNESFEDESIGLLMLSIADNNLYIVDSRRTPAAHIQEINLIKEEFEITTLHFVLNKHLYNPNVIKATLKIIASFYGRLFVKQPKVTAA